MASITPFFERLKPALDNFLKNSTCENLQCLEKEIHNFNWLEAKVVHIHVLLPLLLKLEELNGEDQELRTELINCISLVLSNIQLLEVKALATIVTIVLKQVRNFEKAKFLEDLSEEIKLAAVLCIASAFKNTTNDALEKFYNKNSSSLLGHVILFSVEVIEFDHYRKLKIAAIDCLCVLFYAHDKADFGDIVLRSNVADTLFIYLPKVIGVLYKLATGDDKWGETLKALAIKTFGCILHLIYEDTNEMSTNKTYCSADFQQLMDTFKEDVDAQNVEEESLLLEGKKDRKKIEEKLERLQNKGRSPQWFKETSKRLKGIFSEMFVLRSHISIAVRQEFARMCAKLLKNCAENLKENFLVLLENLIALAEDEVSEISEDCANALKNVQQKHASIFDESADTLFEEHSIKLLQIINRQDEYELYAELLFLKGFFRNVEPKKLFALFSLNSVMQNFCMALITAVDLDISAQFLNEEYSLRQFDESVYLECFKLKWRQFSYLDCKRCVRLCEQICAMLGANKDINFLLFNYFFELLRNQTQRRMNEALVILSWMFAPVSAAKTRKKYQKNINSNLTKLADLILTEIFTECHWNLALHPDEISRLKVSKRSNWFVDATPGLYESRYEIRVQDYDSDDEQTAAEQEQDHVTFSDAQWNVLHTCMVLDAVGHFSTYLGLSFRKHIFRVLHRVLLKVASSNTLVYEAGVFALASIQKALDYDNIQKLIENHTDYISYQLNMLLRKTPDSSSAADILSVVLQFSSHRSLPHLEHIFETLRTECSQTNQKQNIQAYLKVFNVFLICLDRWKISNEKDLKALIEKRNSSATDGSSSDALNCDEILNIWLHAFNKSLLEEPTSTNERVKFENDASDKGTENDNSQPSVSCEANKNDKIELPRHIVMAKQILEETLKFLSNSSQTQQILSLECLIVGVPLLKDYEDVLLPLVHTIWQPLLEKFRQKDPLVLNRCFTLLNVLSTHAKDFILKRSLDNVIPHLKTFLKESVQKSAAEQSNVQTQLYKLQLKLLQEFSNLIISMQIDGKHLNEIVEVIALYLSNKQPKEFQTSAVKFFSDLCSYNGPIIYLTSIKKLHLKDYEQNVCKVIAEFGIDLLKP